ncbi:PLP-dependent transferase [Microthyrium microscopicum]|uniref:PLP-dependent transferase n=1 Tax=Microthyrium microscopicum TaxID=703497 RepID=A0A6A6U761_9PEZI|nr:PLP-dependent transferase [Microthyrium microscopicum]
MKGIPGFKIDKWVQEYGPKSQISLHSSVISPISLRELQKLAPEESQAAIDYDLPLNYGPVQGSVKLRQRIAELHSSPKVQLTEENVIITTGSILANYLVLTSICGEGDHVICQYPTYGQLYALPRFVGAEVDMWEMRAENQWIPSVEELAAMIKPNTKAIILNNPSNPTGTVLPEAVLENIVKLAEKHNILLFSDEVFAPLFHSSVTAPPLISLGYPKTIATGSVSKAQGLAGVRVGWIVSPDRALIEQAMTLRDYTTISVSQLDQSVANFALSPALLPKLMERNLAVCQRTIGMLDEFIKSNSIRCEWVKPAGAGTAFVRILQRDGQPVDEVKFAAGFVQKFGVSVVPGGYCFSQDGSDDFKGYIRVALGDEQKLRDALPLLQQFLGTE